MYMRAQYLLNGCIHMGMLLCVCVCFVSALHYRFLKHWHLQDPTAEVGWHQKILLFCICESNSEVSQSIIRSKLYQCIGWWWGVSQCVFMSNVYNFISTDYLYSIWSFSLILHFLQVFFIITAFFGTGNIASINRYVNFLFIIFKYTGGCGQKAGNSV